MKLYRLLLVGALGLGLLSACGGSTEHEEGVQSSGGVSNGAQEVSHPGAQIYREACSSCHAPGLNGAPKFGDAQAWAPRIAKGAELLLQTTIEGIPPAMPPRGICMHCTDEQLAEAIDYMVVNSQ